jgi:hypothetical protein
MTLPHLHAAARKALDAALSKPRQKYTLNVSTTFDGTPRRKPKERWWILVSVGGESYFADAVTGDGVLKVFAAKTVPEVVNYLKNEWREAIGCAPALPGSISAEEVVRRGRD